ncbi:MAG: hypothetical protein A4E55_00137 [Pelotomaculum sp. PtaU1.Bin035]|nr:MAG: hypothetical protein A4E55_00137 [Pelotomaculum sp. PtaU1.Bin035]
MFSKEVSIPVPLFKSLEGKYFVGYADNLTFGNGANAWAGLINPIDSGVNMYVNVWTITGLRAAPYRAQVWFNTNPSGVPIESDLVIPSNNAIFPPPRPKVKILLASSVSGSPSLGIKAFVRRSITESTMVFEEDGKYIFPPGGNLIVFLSTPEAPEELQEGRVAFGWWEDNVII